MYHPVIVNMGDRFDSLSAPPLPNRERDVIVVRFKVMLEVAMAGFRKEQAA